MRIHPVDLARVHGPEGEPDYFAIPDAELAARSTFRSFHHFGTEHVASAIVEILDESDAVAIHLVDSSPAGRLGGIDNLWRQKFLSHHQHCRWGQEIRAIWAERGEEIIDSESDKNFLTAVNGKIRQIPLAGIEFLSGGV